MLWLSINGKVDASTGDDMPTQILSGELPLKIHSKGNVRPTGRTATVCLRPVSVILRPGRMFCASLETLPRSYQLTSLQWLPDEETEQRYTSRTAQPNSGKGELQQKDGRDSRYSESWGTVGI